MKDFVLLFRQPNYNEYNTASPEEMKAIGKKWHEWFSNIVAQDRLSNNGIRLAMEGKVLRKNNMVTDGPFAEIKEILGSFIVVKAESLDEAVAFAKDCPAIDAGGSVEIRPAYT